jgi:hypothetical protein
MIELLLPYGFDNLEYSWVKATIGIYMLADYSVARNVNIQQVNGESRCLDGILSEYKEECIKALANFEKVNIHHVQWKDNEMANALAQHASRYRIWRGRFGVRPWPMVGSVLVIQDDAETNGRGGVTPED